MDQSGRALDAVHATVPAYACRPSASFAPVVAPAESSPASDSRTGIQNCGARVRNGWYPRSTAAAATDAGLPDGTESGDGVGAATSDHEAGESGREKRSYPSAVYPTNTIVCPS